MLVCGYMVAFALETLTIYGDELTKNSRQPMVQNQCRTILVLLSLRSFYPSKKGYAHRNVFLDTAKKGT